MSNTAILYIPPKPPSTPTSTSFSPLQLISEALHTNYSPIALPTWSLDHRLFFDTSSLLPSAKTPRRFMQYIALSHHPAKAYVGCTRHDAKEEPLPQDIVAVPAGVQTEDFFMFTALRKMEPLWYLRAILKIDGGSGFELKDWTIRLGELKQGGPQGPRGKGWVVEITRKSTEVGSEEITFEHEIRDFWGDIGKGVDGMKPFVTRQPIGGQNGAFAIIELWMEVLRMR